MGFQKPKRVRGANAVSALVLPHVSARTASAMEFAKWRAALANVLIMNNLTQVVEDAKAPTEQAVAGLFSSESQKQIKERFTAALRDYQQENTQLFFLIAPSLNDIKKCPIMNKAVPIGSGTAFARDAQIRYIEGGRAKLVEEPDITTLKDVKFFVKPPDFSNGDGRGKGKGSGGGRGGAPYGRGAGRGGSAADR